MKVCDKRNREIHQIHKSGVLKSLFSCVSCISWFMMICAAFSSYAGAVESTSPVFRLSLKSDGVRTSLGDETLTYSSQWDGGEGATVTIAENGRVLAEGVSGEGTRPWSVTRNGTYVLTHTTYTNGVAGKVETATFVVTGKDVAFAADDVTVAGFVGKYDGAAHGIDVMVKEGIEDVVVRYAAGDGAPALPWSETAPTITDVGAMTVWCEIAAPGYITQTNSATVVISPREVTLTSGSASKAFDGTALINNNVMVGGDGFVDGEGASYAYIGSQTNVGESENTFSYTLNDGTKADNYNITTAYGTLTVTKANVGGGTSGGEEPGDGEVPQGGVSKFDASFVYDGEGHTIDTNALVAAFGSAMVGASSIEYAVDDGGRGVPALPWDATAPVYTNAGEYVVWYRVTNLNYEDFVHAAKLSITKRPVTVTSGSASKSYDGTTLIEPEVIIGGNAFVAGEGATFNVTGCQIVPGASSNTFTYTLKDGTDADNYEISIVYGTLTVLKSASVIWYVDANKGSDSNDGFSWVSAKKSIQSAIDEAVSGNSIIVTNGVYSPIRSLDSDKILQISSVEGAEQTFIDGENSQRCVTSSARGVRGNYYNEREPHSGLRLKGFTICNGNSRNESIDPTHGGGALGGVYENCIIKNNRVKWVSDWNGYPFGYGGGTSHAELVNCVVLTNYAVDGGGGIYEGKVINSLIEGNAVESSSAMASGYGGGGACSALVSNCVIRSNYCGAGSAINDCSVYNSVISNHLDSGTLYYANFHDCLIVNNWDGNDISGSGIAYHCNFYRCTISGNKAFGVLTNHGSINDSIVFGNGDASLDARWTEYNNTWTSDPDFVDAANGDYRLKPISKCIDVGSEDCDAQFDLDGNPRIINGAIDLGCYESQNLYKKVDAPIIQDKVYNGLLQIANVGESEDYEVVSNVGGVSVGEYTVTLRLKDGMSRIWSDNTEGALKTLQWKIVAVEFDDWDDESKWAISFSGNEEKYDGVAKICDVTMLSYDGLPVTNFNVSGNSAIDAGEYTLTVTGSGNFSGSHTFNWSVAKRAVTLTSGSASKAFDGTALINNNVTVGGDGFVDGEGASYNVTGSQTNVGESENTFTYTLDANTKAGNYNITTLNGTLTVTKANVGGAGGDEEPGAGEVPQGGVSKFDASFVYDGEGHTIDTNALVAAFGNVIVGTSVIEYAIDDGSVSGGVGHAALPWDATAPVYTNAGEYIVWYRVTNPNYNEFIHAAKLSITKRDATLTSGSSSWIYDGVAHSNMAVTATGFVDGEGVTTNSFATIENIGSVANAFDYAFINGTLAANYNVTCVTGTLSVVSAQMDEWTDEAKWIVTLSGNNQKYDGTEKTCEVTAIAYDGFSIPTYTVTGNKATDAGEYTLTVAGTGNFSGSHTFNWSIAKRAVTLTSGGASKVYDGTALVNGNVTVGGDGFVDGEGASYNVTGSQMNVGESDNTFSYTLNDGTKASNYNITTVNGTLTVTKANVGGSTDGGEEPGDSEVPQGGVSKFDASFVYDSEGHTIDTNAIVAAFGSAMVGSSVIEYAVDDGSVSGGVGHAALPWLATAPVYTNAGEYIIWYRVTNPNYNEFIHAAKLSITKRDATLTSGSSSWIYDGIAHSNTAVTAAGFVDGEGVTTNNFASIENIGSVANAFDYAFIDGTLAGNYNVTCVTGTLSVVSAQMDEWTDESKWAVTLSGNNQKYDGTEKTCEVTAIAYDGFSIPTYTVTGNKGTDVGNYTLTVTGTGNFSGSHTFNWSIAKRAVTLTSGSASKVYDGTALINNNVTVGGDGFVAGEGASYTYTGSQMNVGESDNTFSYTLNDGTKASNYNITTVNGKLTVTKANVGGGAGGGEEPGTGEVPQGGVSKFDASFVYDSEGHTIDTNAIVAAFGSAMVGSSVIEYAVDDGSVSGGVGHAALPWLATAPVYTNAGEYIIWYRVTNPNYNEFIHAAKLSIAKRNATLTSGSSSWIYDGIAHSNTAVTAAGFVDGEGVTTNNFASIENIGSVANSFDYAFINGTLAANYNVTCVTGTLSVVSAQMDEWTDESKWAVTLSGNNQKYDGTEKTCEVTAIAYDGFSIPTYTVTGNKGTDVGNYTLTVTGTGNFSGSHTFNWSIAKRAVTLTSGSANKTYDGTALINNNVTVGGDGFVDGEGASYNVTGSQTNVGESENTFAYTLNDGTKAGNYNITTANGTLTVTKANVGGGAGGGEEPGAGEVPQGGVSKFDASFVYDGKGHTINTNALTAAFGSAIVGASVIEYAVDDGSVSGGVGHAALPWDATAPAYTNVDEYIIWYRVTNPNYNEFTHAAKVTITPRTGVVVDIFGNVATNMYNGAAQSIDGYTVAINDSLYKETDFEFAGNSSVSGTVAGKYPMGLLASQFTNKNENFTDVTFKVTDGELVILEPSLKKNVILDAIGGTFADGTVVTQECEDVYIAFPVATREGYVFDGWYLGVTNGAPKATAGAGLLVDDDHTLFAKWKIDEALMPGEASIFAWETIDANTARITGFKNSEQKLSTLIFPDTINGKAVVEIADAAFANSRSGMTRILLPMYCVKIGYAAFTGASTLTDIVFSDVRKWQTPDVGTTLSIGAYAFSGVGVSMVTLPATVSAIGDYAFANCAKLSNITILGQPAVGTKPLRRAGTSVGGVTVHLDPALASDNAYMNALKQECLNVTVRADAVVKRMKLSSLSMARNFIVLSVSVEKAAAWGKVDLSAIKVAYRKTLSDEPLMLTPSAIVENPDGSLSVEVPVPAGDSGFFQVVFQK